MSTGDNDGKPRRVCVITSSMLLSLAMIEALKRESMVIVQDKMPGLETAKPVTLDYPAHNVKIEPFNNVKQLRREQRARERRTRKMLPKGRR